MPFNEDHADVLRAAVAGLTGITERRMFGGLCFMLNGNMLCGVHRDGGMARVGKELEAAALEMDGVRPMSFTGRRMGGLVEFSADVFDDDATLNAVLALAEEFVGSLPARSK